VPQSNANLSDAQPRAGFSTKTIVTVSDAYNALVRAVLTAVIEGRAVRQEIQRLATAAAVIDEVLSDMRGTNPDTGDSINV
jgi:hypothetical protein